MLGAFCRNWCQQSRGDYRSIMRQILRFYSLLEAVRAGPLNDGPRAKRQNRMSNVLLRVKPMMFWFGDPIREVIGLSAASPTRRLYLS